MTPDDDLAASVTLCEEALEDAEGNDAIRSQAHRLLALGGTVEGEIHRGLVHARQAVEFAENAGENELLALALSLGAQLETLAGEILPD